MKRAFKLINYLIKKYKEYILVVVVPSFSIILGFILNPHINLDREISMHIFNIFAYAIFAILALSPIIYIQIQSYSNNLLDSLCNTINLIYKSENDYFIPMYEKLDSLRKESDFIKAESISDESRLNYEKRLDECKTNLDEQKKRQDDCKKTIDSAFLMVNNLLSYGKEEFKNIIGLSLFLVFLLVFAIAFIKVLPDGYLLSIIIFTPFYFSLIIVRRIFLVVNELNEQQNFYVGLRKLISKIDFDKPNLDQVLNFV